MGCPYWRIRIQCADYISYPEGPPSLPKAGPSAATFRVAGTSTPTLTVSMASTSAVLNRSSKEGSKEDSSARMTANRTGPNYDALVIAQIQLLNADLPGNPLFTYKWF